MEGGRKMSLKELKTRHLAMIERLVEGAQPRAIHEEFGISEGRLSTIRKSEIWKQEEDRQRKLYRDTRREENRERLEGLAREAIGALADTVTRENDPRVRLQSAKEILDRGGFSGREDGKGEFNPTINLYIPPAWQGG